MSGTTGHVASPHICCKVNKQKKESMLGSVETKKRERMLFNSQEYVTLLLFPDVQYSNYSKKKKLFNRHFYFCKIVPK